jgi:putative copper export protein
VENRGVSIILARSADSTVDGTAVVEHETTIAYWNGGIVVPIFSLTYSASKREKESTNNHP